MYVAPALAVALFAIHGWRLRCKSAEAKGKGWPRWAHFYTPLYCVLAALNCASLETAFDLLRATRWLSADATAQLAKLAHEEDLKLWEEEASLERHSFIAWMSFFTPAWLIGTFMVCAGHTFLHVRECGRSASAHGFRDDVVAYVALPAVYGLLAFNGVVHMWLVVTNAFRFDEKQGWDDTRKAISSLYDLHIALANVSVAYAVHCFARLAMSIIWGKVKNQRHLIRAFMRRGLRHFTQGQEQEPGTEATPQMPAAVKLIDAARRLSTGGISYFCFSCVAYAVCVVLAQAASNFEVPVGPLHRPQASKRVQCFFLGMGAISSVAAIQNLAHLEHAFADSLLLSFVPARKFWSAKVLAAMPFLQLLLLYVPPVSMLSETRRQLLYASVLCLQCFVLSCFNLAAWHHGEQWHAHAFPERGDLELSGDGRASDQRGND